MITNYIDGTSIGTDYDVAVKDDSRQFLARFMLNGTELDCGIKRVEFTTGSCADTNAFAIGSVIGCSMTAEVLNLNDDVKGSTLDLQIGLNVNDVWKWIKVGQYKISEVKKTIHGATLVGYGKVVSDSSGNFTEPGTKTLRNIGTEIATELGGTVYFDSSIDRTKIIIEPMSGLTTYQAIQVVAQVIGGYAVDRLDGGVNFLLYDDTPTHTVDSSLMNSLPDLEEVNFEITGVQCIVSESSTDGETAAVGYTQGTPINLSYNCKYITQDLFTSAATSLIGYTYRPGSINLSLGDPRLIFGDVLEVTDADGSVYVVPCHSLRHVYDGGFRTEIVAASATNLENNIGTVTPQQDYKKSTEQEIVQLNADLEDLAEGIQYFWYDSDGAHVSTIPQSRYLQPGAGANCYEVLIASSQIIFRRGTTGLSSTWTWTILGTYASSGITLKDYAQMNSSGIILGDINDQYYQLILSPTKGLYLNTLPVAISDYSTDEITETTSTIRIVPGFMDSTSTILKFTVPIECIVPEGTSVNITALRANFKIDGTSYFIDGSYYAGGYSWLGAVYTVTGSMAGTAMTITITKSSTFKKNGTNTAVDAYSAITCEIDRVTWVKPATSRNAVLSKSSPEVEETKAINPPVEMER